MDTSDKKRQVVDFEAHSELYKVNSKVRRRLIKDNLSNDLFTDINFIESQFFLDDILKLREPCHRVAISLNDFIARWEIDIDWHATITNYYPQQPFTGRFELCFVDFGTRGYIRNAIEMCDNDGYMLSDDRDFLRNLEQIRERARRELRFITVYKDIHTEAELLSAISSTVYEARKQLFEMFNNIMGTRAFGNQEEQNKTVSDLIEKAFGGLTYTTTQVDGSTSLADIRFVSVGENGEEKNPREALNRVW